MLSKAGAVQQAPQYLPLAGGGMESPARASITLAGACERTATRVACSRPGFLIGRFSFYYSSRVQVTPVTGGVNSSKEWGCALLRQCAAMPRLQHALAAIPVRGGRTCNIIRVDLHGCVLLSCILPSCALPS